MLTRLTLISALLILSGCAIPREGFVEKKDKSVKSVDEAVSETKVQRKQEELLARVNRNFYADEPIELPYAAKLPKIFFEDISIRSSGKNYGSVEQAARYFSLATGLAVRLAPDVKMPPPSRRGSGGTVTAANTAAAAPSAATDYLADPAAKITEDSLVRLDYSGPAINYIKMISESAGIEWEYKENSVIFSRLITRTFQLDNVNPGALTLSDSISKGGSASTGQVGTALSNSVGSFSTQSAVSTQAAYSPWAELRTTLQSCLTTAGNLSISEGIGSVTVTDTRDSVECIRKNVERENSEFGKQVLIEVRSIRVRTNDTAQMGVELGPVYSILSNGKSAAQFRVVPPPNTSTLPAGRFTAIVNNETSQWYESAGFVQALKQLGTVVSDSSSSVVTSNRVPAMTATYNTYGFLAETKAGAVGANGVSGTPGLTPGSVTVGTFLRVLPTIRSNNTIMFNLSLDKSNLLGFDSASTGAGSTEQKIQWANTDGNKISSNVSLNQNETLVLAGISEENLQVGSAQGIGGISSMGDNKKLIYIIIVTPRILKGL